MNDERWQKLKAQHTDFDKLSEELLDKYPEEMAEAKEWVRKMYADLLLNSEELPLDMQQLMVDNLNKLYEE